MKRIITDNMSALGALGTASFARLAHDLGAYEEGLAKVSFDEQNY